MTTRTLPLLLLAALLACAAYLGVRELLIYRSATASISAQVTAMAETLPPLRATPPGDLGQTFLTYLNNCQKDAMRSTIQESSHYLGGINRAVKTDNHEVLSQIAAVLLNKCMQQFILTVDDLEQMLARNAMFGERAVFPIDSDQWARDWMKRQESAGAGESRF